MLQNPRVQDSPSLYRGPSASAIALAGDSPALPLNVSPEGGHDFCGLPLLLATEGALSC